MTQLQGVVEVCCREQPGAFINRERDDFKMLLYPEKDSPSYNEIVKDKVDHVRREEFNIVIEGDRRRTSMLVENVMDPDFYIGAMSDFLHTIFTTMVIDLRPRQRNGSQGQFCKFEEGILCQKNSVFPGMEAKLTTGSDDLTSGWYSAILAIIRRLIQEPRTFGTDASTTMLKTSINIKDVNKKKAEIILGALKKHEETVASSNISKRQQVPSGRIVKDFINEAAALTKRLFMAKTRNRVSLAERMFEYPLEKDQCFGGLGGARKMTVLRFCRSCNFGKTSNKEFFMNLIKMKYDSYSRYDP